MFGTLLKNTLLKAPLSTKSPQQTQNLSAGLLIGDEAVAAHREALKQELVGSLWR